MPRAKIKPGENPRPVEYMVVSKERDPKTGELETITPVIHATLESATKDIEGRYLLEHEDVTLARIVPFRREVKLVLGR